MTKIKAATILAVGLTFAGPATLISAPELAETREILKEWVGVKKTISEEAADWKVEEQVLQEQKDLLGEEIDRLKDQIDQYEKDASAADKERERLTQEEDEKKQAAAVVRESIRSWEEKVLDLARYFPPPLTETDAVRKILPRIPRDANMAKGVNLSQRVQNVILLVTEFEKFNRGITISQGTQEIDNRTVSVDTIYIGMAVGYWVDGTNSKAGILTPAKDGWTSTEDPSLAAEIRAAVGILKDGEEPRFLNLPVDIQ